MIFFRPSVSLKTARLARAPRGVAIDTDVRPGAGGPTKSRSGRARHVRVKKTSRFGSARPPSLLRFDGNRRMDGRARRICHILYVQSYTQLPTSSIHTGIGIGIYIQASTVQASRQCWRAVGIGHLTSLYVLQVRLELEVCTVYTGPCPCTLFTAPNEERTRYSIQLRSDDDCSCMGKQRRPVTDDVRELTGTSSK